MKLKKKVIAAIASTLCFATMMSTTAYASGDVAGAVQSTWTTARSQVVLSLIHISGFAVC